ncbi:MAG: phosphoribosylaminoimidazolesuccinocarboxamide synthase [Candidatus Omnitrophica bacterium]|nr:phosphoribosylaminoimidazolesuccinocarboxamide synthase [Candidatus Omnitrophota bacterium]
MILDKAELKGFKLFKRGKVRDVYDLDDKLLMIATDRISCFDVVLPTPIPEKGKILTRISLFWFSFLKDIVDNHLISDNLQDLPPAFKEFKETLSGRFMLTKKCKVMPFECVVRGYLSGSGWKEYKASNSVCGINLPRGLVESSKLREPIFSPATKAESGHDENVDFNYMKNKIGAEFAERMKNLSLSLYAKASEFIEEKGIIIADTKFEFGFDGEELILVDEALTPDSSRFWPKEEYAPGGPQASFDKQYVRDYLESLDWDKTPPGPVLPDEVVTKTREKYLAALKIVTGKTI